jgi:NAD(P)-dependent dehydrogenase (short-subunit alcohol dehydrogenase family)
MKCIITGATDGIGRETAIKMANFGYDLVLPVRNIQKAEKLKLEIQKDKPKCQVYLYQCDFADLDSVVSFVGELEKDKQVCQVLINNVGIWNRSKELTKQGFESTFAVNHLSMFLLTSLLLAKNLLQANSQNSNQKARIVNLSSMGHYFARVNWDDLQFETKYNYNLAYYNSKLFNVLFTQKLAKILKLKNPNITCNCLHPGIVNTSLLILPELIRKSLGWLIMTPEKGARNSFFVATDTSLENITGEYFDNFKIKKPSQSANTENQDKLWQISEKLLQKYLV